MAKFYTFHDSPQLLKMLSADVIVSEIFMTTFGGKNK